MTDHTFAQMRRDFGRGDLGVLAFIQRLESYGYRLVSVGEPYLDRGGAVAEEKPA